ncbi:MAG: hypothetical protein ACYDCK_01565 [Thermoplasmatota archaeon]
MKRAENRPDYSRLPRAPRDVLLAHFEHVADLEVLLHMPAAVKEWRRRARTLGRIGVSGGGNARRLLARTRNGACLA